MFHRRFWRPVSLISLLLFCGEELTAQTIYPITSITKTGSELNSLTVSGTVYGRNRMVGGAVTGFVGAGPGVVLVPGGTSPPPPGSRATLCGDWFLDSGLINPATTVDAMTITFPQPIVNQPGPDIVIFEVNPSNAADACNVKINGVTVAVGTTSWGFTGEGIISADQYNTKNSASTADITPTTIAQVESAPLLVSSLDISQGIFGIAFDLSSFGVAAGASVNSLTIWSTGTSYIDPVFVGGLILPPEQTAGPVIEEIMASNSDTLQDEDLDYPDWLEIYNGSGVTVNLLGWTLTDDPAVPAKWAFPSISLGAYSYTYVFCSGKNKFTGAHPHTNFKLKKAGGTVILSRPDSSAVTTLTYPAQVDGISYGAVGSEQTVGYLETPSPGTANLGRQAAASPLDDVIFDKPSGVVTGSTTLAMSVPATAGAGAVIRYTLDSSVPSESSPVYTAPLTFTSGATVSARVFNSGALPSRVARRSFVLLASDIAANYNSSGQPFSSNLPIVVLDSFGINVDGVTDPLGARPDKFTEAIVYDVDPTSGRATLGAIPSIISRSGTHVRGQSSSSFSQKPYSLQFWKEYADEGKNVALTGFPADSDWVLQTLYTDKTFMRNYLMQSLMLETNGANAGRRCRFVEVFFNQGDGICNYSDYRGVYLLIEKIRRGTDRVDISKLNGEMTASSLISGGYIFKKDKTPYDSPFLPPTVSGSAWNGLTYDVYDPSPPTTAQLNWIKSYVNQADTAIMQTDFANPASGNYYGKWLDWRSFIDKQIWQETCKEVDSYIFSYYYSKDRGQPLRAYPFWDVDRSLGNANYGTADNAFGYKWWVAGTGYAYFPRLFLDPEFTQAYWDRWWKLRRSIFDTPTFHARIEAAATQLTAGVDAALVTNTAAPTMQNAAARHFRKWSTLGASTYGSGPPGQPDRNTFRKELDLMKSWFQYRQNWYEAQSPSRPPDLLDALTKQPKFGGAVSPGFQAVLVNPNEAAGTVYYTINGSDPRQTGGSVAGGVQTATPGTVVYTSLLTSGSSWKYIAPTSAVPPAQGSVAWKDKAYDDTTWTVAPAPLGYGESSGLATNISPTPPAQTTSTVPPPVYFRNTFNVTGAASLTGLNLELMADDGAVVYVNGVEAARSGMPYPPTVIAFSTQASGPVDDASRAEPAYNLIRLSPTLLQEGANTIAVEVHQALYTSSPPTADMRFDLRVKATSAGADGVPITLATSGSYTIRARTYFGGTTWSPLTEATYVVDAAPASSANLAISEILFAPVPASTAEGALGYITRDFEYIELQNVGSTYVDLGGAYFSDGVTYTFPTNNPGQLVLSPGARIVVSANPSAFASRYANGSGVVVVGPYSGNLANEGEQITLRSATGAIIAQFTYSPLAPWPPGTGSGYSLVLNTVGPNPNYSDPAAWRPSTSVGGTPGAQNGVSYTGSPAGDSDSDGYSDFLEFATGTIASDPASFAQPELMLSTVNGLTGTFLYFSITRNLNADGVSLLPEISTDLQTWAGDQNAVVYLGMDRNPDGTARVKYRTAQPVDASIDAYVRFRALTP